MIYARMLPPTNTNISSPLVSPAPTSIGLPRGVVVDLIPLLRHSVTLYHITSQYVVDFWYGEQILK